MVMWNLCSVVWQHNSVTRVTDDDVSLGIDVCVWTCCSTTCVLVCEVSRKNRTAIIWGIWGGRDVPISTKPKNNNKDTEGCEMVWVDLSHVINPWVSEVVDDGRVWSFSILSCCCGDGVHSTDYATTILSWEIVRWWALESSTISYNEYWIQLFM